MAESWKIEVIRAAQVNNFRVKKQKALNDDKTTAEIEEVVEALLNDMASKGWSVYDIRIGSNDFARIVFFRDEAQETNQGRLTPDQRSEFDSSDPASVRGYIEAS